MKVMLATYDSEIYVKGSTSNEFEVDYCGKLEEVIELQYHNEQNKIFLFKWYWYDTIDKGIRLNLHHGLVKINTKDFVISTMFLFLSSSANKFIIHTLLHLEIIILELICYPLWNQTQESCPSYSGW